MPGKDRELGMRASWKTIRSGLFAAAALVLIVDVWLTVSNVRTLTSGTMRVRRSREAVTEIERALSLLKDAETGQRGFLLTGDESYLEPYLEATRLLGPQLDRVATLTADDSMQRSRVENLRAAVADKMAELADTVSSRRLGSSDRYLAIVKSGRGKRTMDAARRAASLLVASEQSAMGHIQTQMDRAGGWTFLTLFAVTALAIVLLLAAWFFARRERLQREQADAARRTWLTTVLTSIGDAVIVTDGQGHVAFINPVASVLTGWSDDDARGRPLAEVFPIVSESTREPVENPVDRVFREGTVVGLGNHTLLVDRGGSERPIDDSAAPVRERDGAISGVVLVFRDVTERRRIEVERERLLESERAAHVEAEAANQAKDHFLAVLSHELRTPLNPVLLAVSEMVECATTPEANRPTLEMIRDYVKLEARLIDDLLDATRIKTGKMNIEYGVADCHALLAHAVEICRDDAVAKGVQIELHRLAKAYHVNGDSARLQQALWNLIKNAVKFTPAGGSVTIRTVSGESGNDLTIEVTDTGIGIAPEALTRIFDPFQQAEKSTMRKFGGLGLGLAITRGVVEAHGGLLTAESLGEGRGSTFRVCLRALSSPEWSSQPTDAPRRTVLGDASLKILLVEDEPATLRLLFRMLRNRNHDVVTADTFADAVAALQGAEFDLLISDIGLPDGTGLDLMRQIAVAAHTRGIALTGYGMEEDLSKSREAGFSAHMTKPIDFDRLEMMIEQVMAGKPRVL